MTDPTARAHHWDDRYTAVGADAVSWYEAVPELSLDLVDRAAGGSPCSVVDVGGGASSLAAVLVERGFTDVTVLDVSEAALDVARSRLAHPEAVTWVRADLLQWAPTRRWHVWHDRAVFHFLTDPADRATYRRLLHEAVEPGGVAIVATFAADGPTHCSGLPVERYDADALLHELGDDLATVDHGRVEHHTPGGAVQPFTWVVVRRAPVR